jgi:hypothetical protein
VLNVNVDTSKGNDAPKNAAIYEHLADYIKSETVKWAKVVKDSGAKVD